MTEQAVLDWLLAGDAAVRYQATRDLLGRDDVGLQALIATEGQGAALLAARGADGHWGRGFYQPKWTSSHYTLLELKNLGVPPTTAAARETVALILGANRVADGGLNPTATVCHSDACVNGMALGYCAYFGGDADQLATIVDFLLSQRMPDGGFNCQSNRSGARHAALNSTTCVVEGITAYERAGYTHRLGELLEARARSAELLLAHRLFRSHRTGEVIRAEFLRLHYPTRWYYDVLRGLDALREAGARDDQRMADALAVLTQRRRDDGRWVVNRAYPGRTHVQPEPAGKPSRWVTLLAKRVLRTYGAPAA